MKNVFKPNGLHPSKPLPTPQLKLALKLSVTLLAAGLALCGCASVPTSTNAALDTNVVCKPWRPIYYSKVDTARTIYEVQVHNRTGERLRCW